MKLTRTARPGPLTVHPEGYVPTTLHTTQVPPFPKGLPAPPLTPTTYPVYVTPHQWHQIAPALTNAEDRLMVEGFPPSAPARTGITVSATRVPTKQQQQAQRAAQHALREAGRTGSHAAAAATGRGGKETDLPGRVAPDRAGRSPGEVCPLSRASVATVDQAQDALHGPA